MYKFLIVLVLAAVAGLVQGQSSKIHENLKQSLQHKDHVDIFVAMKDGSTTSVLEQVTASLKSSSTHAQRTTAVYNALTQHAAKSQHQVIGFLQKSHPTLEFKSFWIINQIYIKHAHASLIQKLAAMEQVSEIQEEPITHIDNVFNSTSRRHAPRLGHGPQQDIVWGLSQMNVPQVWAQGIVGAGLVIGNIDTGVRGSHELLRDKWVGLNNYGWFDPEFKTTVPLDVYNHGTHTMGTLVGSGGMGIVPEARWLACKGYRDDGSALSSSFVACGEYMTCPVDSNGNNADCSKAPHVVSNSFGWYGGVTLFNPVLEAWMAAGILSSFSAGNEGPTCGQLLSPADQPNAIAVAAHDSQDYLANWSSRGPSLTNLRKPDVSGPGVGVWSASSTGDTAYMFASGTSMSCPNTSGVLALMKSFDINLTHTRARDVLEQTAQRIRAGPSGVCGGISDEVFPSNHRGWGRVDAAAAIAALRGSSK